MRKKKKKNGSTTSNPHHCDTLPHKEAITEMISKTPRRPLLDLEEAACTTTSPQQPPRTGVVHVLHSSPYLEKKG
jgi:hypothetical protein